MKADAWTPVNSCLIDIFPFCFDLSFLSPLSAFSLTRRILISTSIMDDQLHPADPTGPPKPVESLVPEDKVSSLETMATDESTANPEGPALLEHEDNGEITGEDSFVSTRQLPYRTRENPAKSDVEDSKLPDMAEKCEPQNLETEDSVSFKHPRPCSNTLGAT